MRTRKTDCDTIGVSDVGAAVSGASMLMDLPGSAYSCVLVGDLDLNREMNK